MPRRLNRAQLAITAISALAAVAVLVSACGLTQAEPAAPTPTPVNGNLLANPGFEVGNDPWTSPEGAEGRPFTVTDSVSYNGDHSLELVIETEAGAADVAVTGAQQTVSAADFPEFASGYVRFAEWEQSDPPHYAEFVVRVRGGDFGDGQATHEVRFIIAGLPAEPPPVEGVRYLFLSRDDPEDLNEWIYFGYPVLDAFRGRFGFVPTTWESIEFAVQLRHDTRTDGAERSHAGVQFDDLYMGQQILDPNRPILGVLPDS